MASIYITKYWSYAGVLNELPTENLCLPQWDKSPRARVRAIIKICTCTCNLHLPCLLCWQRCLHSLWLGWLATLLLNQSSAANSASLLWLAGWLAKIRSLILLQGTYDEILAQNRNIVFFKPKLPQNMEK